MVYVALSFAYLLVNTPDTPENTKLLASLIPQVTMYLLSVPFAGFESVGIGLNMTNVDMLFENYQVWNGFKMLILDLIIYSVIGIYLDNTLPRSFGQRFSPFYPCHRVTPTYWDCADLCRKRSF